MQTYLHRGLFHRVSTVYTHDKRSQVEMLTGFLARVALCIDNVQTFGVAPNEAQVVQLQAVKFFAQGEGNGRFSQMAICACGSGSACRVYGTG